LIENLPQYNFVGFFDDYVEKGALVLDVFPVLGTIQELLTTERSTTKLAIGLGYSLHQRESLFRKLYDSDSEILPTLVHPNAEVDEQTILSAGAHIHSGSVIRVGAKIGANVVVNSGAIIDHHVSVGPQTMISPGAVLCGRVTIGNGTFIGAGAIILPGVKIGHSCVIGAGTLVLENVPDNMMCIGNPGRIMPITEGAGRLLRGAQ
jgi:sugar O-acyltransferase (sialic acid O-acetyltransferase NeuD family)